MQIETLKEFVELSNYLSYGEAAKKLHISQPALSNHIIELEKELGVNLINRSRPIKLTAAGKSFYNDACRIVAIYSDATKNCQRVAQSEKQGTLTIMSPFMGVSGEARSGFLKLIASFRNDYPFIEINMKSPTNRSFFEELDSGSIDCGLMSGNMPEMARAANSDTNFLLYAVDPLVLWMSPENPLATKEHLSLSDMENCAYPIPAGAQYKELSDSAMGLLENRGIKPKYRFILAKTFEEYLFSTEPGDVMLGVSPADELLQEQELHGLSRPVRHAR